MKHCHCLGVAKNANTRYMSRHPTIYFCVPDHPTHRHPGGFVILIQSLFSVKVYASNFKSTVMICMPLLARWPTPGFSDAIARHSLVNRDSRPAEGGRPRTMTVAATPPYRPLIYLPIPAYQTTFVAAPGYTQHFVVGRNCC
jgi:hypothetical protein